jgi:hypothetical protein
MTERIEPEIETGNEGLFGTTIADHENVGTAEAVAALNTDEVEEVVPEEDLDFEKDTEMFDFDSD